MPGVGGGEGGCIESGRWEMLLWDVLHLPERVSLNNGLVIYVRYCSSNYAQPTAILRRQRRFEGRGFYELRQLSRSRRGG